jgi:hypothetical protein
LGFDLSTRLPLRLLTRACRLGALEEEGADEGTLSYDNRENPYMFRDAMLKLGSDMVTDVVGLQMAQEGRQQGWCLVDLVGY